MAWERYDRWNSAIASVVFSKDGAGRPAYLDLEDDVLDAVRDIAEPEASDAAAALVAATKDTLVFERGPAKVLRGHLRRLDQWREGDWAETPPSIALLALFSLAAEKMRDGEGMRDTNFYGRLQELLALSDDETKWLENAYRRRERNARDPASTVLWESLNHWLEILEGNRGLPSAFAVGHTHIGLPLSQALVREADRKDFEDLFAVTGLAPYGTIFPADMEDLLAEWISRASTSAGATLVKLWATGSEAQERITAVALETLASWDGSSSVGVERRGTGAKFDLVRASATLRSFPKRKLDIALVVPGVCDGDGETVEVLDQAGETIGKIDLVPAASGYLTLADIDGVEIGSFLSGDVKLHRSGASTAMDRRPRRVVPLRHEPLLNTFLECERLQLGERSCLLANVDLSSKIEELLGRFARPGFEELRELPGVPRGWSLFVGIEMVSPIPDEVRKSGKFPVELQVLCSIGTSNAQFAGGMRLPGNIEKWSSLAPPELRASADAGSRLSASIECIRHLAEPRPDRRYRSVAGEVLIWDLSQEYLPNGDYEVVVFDGDEEIWKRQLRLRSADNPALHIPEDSGRIGHLPDSKSFGLFAHRTNSSEAFQTVGQCEDGFAGGETPGGPRWFSARKNVVSRKPKRLVFPASDSQSCIITGAHVIQFETAHQGMTSVEGVCKTCGVVKRAPAFRGKAKRSRKNKTSVATPKLDISKLPTIKKTDGIDWQLAFDAVCHVGAGAPSMLDRIAGQIDGAAVFGDSFRRRLEVLGHIEVERDPINRLALSWEVSDPKLVGLHDGSAIWTGFRSDAARAAVGTSLKTPAGPSTRGLASTDRDLCISGLDETELAPAPQNRRGHTSSSLLCCPGRSTARSKPSAVERSPAVPVEDLQLWGETL